MLIMVAPDDRALRQSAILGQRKHVGALVITNSAAQHNNVAMIDISNVDANSDLDQDKYVNFVSIFPNLGREVGQRCTPKEAKVFALSSTRQVISAPLQAINAAFGQ